MKIDRQAKSRKDGGYIDPRDPRTVAIGLVLACTLVGAAAVTGFHAGQAHVERAAVEEAADALFAELDVERRHIADARAEQRAHLDAVALRVAELQAHTMRLDALGDRLVEAGALDPEEFDFSRTPPVGGAEDDAPAASQSLADLELEMRRIDGLLDDREDKLEQLEQVLMTRVLKAEVTPSGRPVKKGWLSSGFGKRTDPFTGKKSYHRGVDFAGKRGSDVVAVAAGVVLRSERTAGYGNLVEIRHADGYRTIYGHNQENLVLPGDVVAKGQTIGLLGSTGRSSGPHVHFEVHKNDKIVNPLRFVR